MQDIRSLTAGHFTSGNFGISLLSDNEDVYSFNITKSYRPADATDFMRLMDLAILHINLKSLFLMNLESKDMYNDEYIFRGAAFKTRLKNLIEARF